MSEVNRNYALSDNDAAFRVELDREVADACAILKEKLSKDFQWLRKGIEKMRSWANRPE